MIGKWWPVVLVELPGGEGIVRRDDGEIVVCRDVGAPDRGGTPREGDRFLPIKTWLSDGRWLIGGLLPSAAEQVEVVDDRGARVVATVGDGVYAVIIDRSHSWYDPIVCCRDGAAAPFVTLTTPSGRWVAVRRHHGLTVTIAARGVEPGGLLIEPIADPAGLLLGSEPAPS